MKKRILFAVLAMMLIAALFAGCSAPAPESPAASYAQDEAGAADYAELQGAPEEKFPAASEASAAPVQDGSRGSEQSANENAGYVSTVIVPDSSNKIILTKYIQTKTKNFDSDLSQLITALKVSGGYVQESNVSGVKPKKYGDKGRRAHYVFRVPRLKVEEFVTSALKVGEVELNRDTSQDITGQYMDTEARLKTLRIKLERLQDLESKATKMSDIIELENSIQQVTYEIESLESQKRGWDNLVDYATIDMDITEVNTIPKALDEPKPIDEPDYGEQLTGGFMSVLTGVVDFFKTLALVLFSGLPVIVPAAAIVLIILFSIRANKRKRTNKTDQL